MLVCKIVNETVEVGGIDKVDLNSFLTISGKGARVCYSDKSYFESVGIEPEKARERAISSFKSNHATVGQHYHISVLFEGLSKFQACILNDLEVYNTSERSGRYTKMVGNTAEQNTLYEKWRGKFNEILEVKCPNIENRDKIAMENARYVLSIFTRSTTMLYTTNVVQWVYIADLLNDLVKAVESKPNAPARETVLEHLTELRDVIREKFDLGLAIKDVKKSCFNGFSGLMGEEHMMYGVDSEWDSFGLSYLMSYECSLVAFADIQRHRACKYFLGTDLVDLSSKRQKYFIPPFIRGTDLEVEWLADLSSVAELIPQGTLLTITEEGYIGDFLLKCRERLCGRVQYEVFELTRKQLLKFKNKGILPRNFKTILNEYIKLDGGVYPKCKHLSTCEDGCDWVKKGLDINKRSC